jgi:hypothetical protein
MKRSEMLKKIREGVNWYTHDSELYAEEMLEVIEKAGMLPPDYMSPTGCPCGLPGCNAPGIINEWEQEDG